MKFRRHVGIVLSVALAATLAACTSAPSEDDGPTHLTVGIGPSGYAFMQSSLTGGSLIYSAGRAVYESLLSWDYDALSYEPWLAADWELSEANRRMVVTLRDDVDFVDGAHMDAQAVVEFFDFFFEQRGLSAGIEVEATGEYTLEFRTQDPMGEAFIDEYMRFTGIVSPAAMDDLETLGTNHVGTGPYLVVEDVPEVSVIFERNPDYWNPEAFPFDELEYIVLADAIATGNALKSGQIDIAGVDQGVAADLESEGFTITTAPSQHASLLVLDYEGDVLPPLGDVRVRRAMAMAFDNAGIVDAVLGGYGIASDQQFGEGHPLYVEDAGRDVYPYDVEGAKDLLAEAGYPDGFDLVIPNGRSIGFYPETFEAILQESLGQIGIRVTFETYSDTGALLAAMQTGNYPVMLGGFAIPTNTLAVIQGDAALLGHFWQDETFKGLVTATNEGVDGAAQDLGQFLLDEVWYITLAQTAGINASIPEVSAPGVWWDLSAVQLAD